MLACSNIVVKIYLWKYDQEWNFLQNKLIDSHIIEFLGNQKVKFEKCNVLYTIQILG